MSWVNVLLYFGYPDENKDLFVCSWRLQCRTLWHQGGPDLTNVKWYFFHHPLDICVIGMIGSNGIGIVYIRLEGEIDSVSDSLKSLSWLPLKLCQLYLIAYLTRIDLCSF